MRNDLYEPAYELATYSVARELGVQLVAAPGAAPDSEPAVADSGSGSAPRSASGSGSSTAAAAGPLTVQGTQIASWVPVGMAPPASTGSSP
eukprot:3188461-Prymnesium_polylepis.1